MTGEGFSGALLDVGDAKAEAFFSCHESACIFHHPAWSRLISRTYSYRPQVLVMLDPNGKIAAALPVMEINSLLTGRRIVCLPFTDHCRPLSQDPEAHAALVRHLERLFLEKQLPRVDIRWEVPAPSVPFYTSSDHVLHLVTLDADPDATVARIARMHRRNFETAKRKGVRVEMGRERWHVRAFYRLHVETRRRQGVPVQPWRFFSALADGLLQQNLGFVLLAYYGEQCLAAAIFLHWQNTLTYKYGASSFASLPLRPNNLIFWEAILWGCENGYGLLDMGRTANSNRGLREFKKGWGAKEVPLIYSTWSFEPPKAGPGTLSLLAEKLIKTAPGWVGRMIGQLLYKHYG